MKRSVVPTREQKELIDLNDGCFLIIAPPGSGKTTVLTERVVRLVSNPADTFRVLGITFTNKAANNMRARLYEAVGEHSSRVTACTIHAFCLDALRNYGEQIGVPANLSIYENDADRMGALHRGLVEEGIYSETTQIDTKLLGRLLHEIGTMKRSLVPPEEAPQTVEEGLVPLHIAYAAYDRTLRQFGALDFDDILFFAFRLFSQVDSVAKQYRRVYKYIVVDEAQDTNTSQYEVLRALCGTSHRNVMLVADADQSIFRFAGATTKNLLRFEAEFSAKRRGLSQNFRCAERIVTAANALIGHNPGRITAGAKMTSAILASGHVVATSYGSEAAEAEATLGIVDTLLQGLDPAWCYSGETTTMTPEDICILGRSRYVLVEVLAALERTSRPFQFSAGRDSLFESQVFACFEAALRLVHNPADALARGALTRCSTASTLAVHGAGTLESLLGSLLNWRANVLRPLLTLQKDPSALNDTLREIVARTRVADIPDEGERATTLADAIALETRWAEVRRSLGTDATVGRFLSDLALAGRGGIDGPGIRVLTIHAAKSVEFRAVILVGMNEGNFPDYRSHSAEEIADERRNAYVAITRAERALYLSRPRIRMMPWGDPKAQRSSRFLVEAGIVMADSE
jgi:DNA helicase-2/ATP-dependent DNA helicase PcrA